MIRHCHPSSTVCRSPVWSKILPVERHGLFLPVSVVVYCDLIKPEESLADHGKPYPEPALLGENLVAPFADLIVGACSNQKYSGEGTWDCDAGPGHDHSRPEKEVCEHTRYVAPMCIVKAHKWFKACWCITDRIWRVFPVDEYANPCR